MLLGFFIQGQVFNMSDGDVTTCSGDFYDSGGASSNYEPNEDLILTFSPETDGAYLQFNFSSFDLKNPGDILYIYDGTGTEAPMIGGFFHKNSPGLITAENTGDLTFHFISQDHNKTKSGWHASISCVEAQQPNNTCSEATAVSEVEGLLFTTVNATVSGKHPDCGGEQAPVDLWYAYTPSNTGMATFELCGNSFKTRLAVWELCDNTEPLACNSATGNNPCTSVMIWVEEGETYYVQVGGKNGATGVGELSIDLIEPYWTGSLSSDWNDPANWYEGNVPEEYFDVTIPTIPLGGNYPETNTGAGAVCRNLTIEPGAHLFVPVNNSLSVFGMLTNNAGTTGLVIKADENGMGSLLHDSPGIEATVEQYLISERNHMVSSPINDAMIETYAGIYFYRFDEPTNTWDNITESAFPMMVTQGYRVWASDDITGSTTVDFAGPLNNGDYGINALSYTPESPTTGWNLIGNPYPSALQWNNLWTKYNISEWACVENNGTQECYNALTGAMYPEDGGIYMPDGIIPSTQGFWVRALTADASLTIPQGERMNSDQPFYKDEIIQIAKSVRIQLEGKNGTDAAMVQFTPEATVGFDGRFDLEKFIKRDNEPQLYTCSENTEYAVNVLPENPDGLIVPMGFEADEAGIFTISLTNFEGFDPETKIFLEDKSDNSLTLISETAYSFSGSPADSKQRFNLHFKSGDALNGHSNAGNVQVYAHDNVVYVQQPDDLEGLISIYNMMGQEILSTQRTGQGQVRIKVDNKPGFYLVKIQYTDQLITEKVFIQ